MAGSFPLNVIEKMMDMGGLFFLPDTMPIQGREHLRNVIEQAIHRGENSEHLAEWQEIIRVDNPARNKMLPFARMFELQHYWRLLHQRHASAISRKLGKCHNAFASIFDVKSRQIKQDLSDTKNGLARIGKKEDRPSNG